MGLRDLAALQRRARRRPAPPYTLRATLSDRSRLALTAPFVRADTLYGRVRGDTVGVPVAEVFGLERQRISPERTAAVLIGVPAVALGVTYLVVCGSNECSPDY